MTNVDDSVGPELLFAIPKRAQNVQTPSPRRGRSVSSGSQWHLWKPGLIGTAPEEGRDRYLGATASAASDIASGSDFPSMPEGALGETKVIRCIDKK